MMRRALVVILLAGLARAAGVGAQALAPPPTAETVQAAIDQLGSFDFPVRMESARLVRRAPADIAIQRLTATVRSHGDEYVRYRALTLLSGFGGSAVAGVMTGLLADPNDRIRAVVYAWLEHNPDPEALPALIEAFGRERSEFVRPALTRAIAAQSGDPRARVVLAPVVLRGDDFFRGSAIEALGEFGAAFALPDIVTVARREGPLQEDAITAIGRLGDAAQVNTLVALQRTAPADAQPTISAALCLLGRACDETEAYLKQTLSFAASTEGYQKLVRGAVHALAMLALRDRPASWNVLLDAGVAAASDDIRSPVALGVGLVALRRPELVLSAFERRADVDQAIDLLRDAFDMLSEDFEEERFYVAVRKAYWAAPPDSASRRVAEAIMQKLEF
jgi:HEAT repeat protein